MKKRILVCLLVVIAALGCTLVACDQNGGTTKCEHVYTEDWQYDETGHWKECTICGEKDSNGVLNHYLDSQGQCNRCDYRKSTDVGINYRDGNILYTEKSDGTYEMVKLFDTSVTSATIPATVNGKAVTSIGQGAFMADKDNLVHNKNIEHVTLPEGILEIKDLAFWGCEKLQNVIIPSTVTKMERGVFKECTSITEITIPNGASDVDTAEFFNGCVNLQRAVMGGATSIGEQCFRGCSKLTEVVFGDVTSIGDFAFYECASLTSISVPDTVTSIGGAAFRGCTLLATVNYGANSQLTSIGQSAFQDCTSITSVALPANVELIDQSSFANCTSITSFTFNNKLETIGAGALFMCSNISSITIPSSVKAIQWGAFYGLNKITSLVVPDSVTDLGIYFLCGCTSLEELTVPFVGGSIQYRRNLGYFFDDVVNSDRTMLTRGDAESNRETVPASLRTLTITKATGIGDYAFASCQNLVTIHVPETIMFVGEGAFRDCTKLSFNKESDAWYIGSQTNEHLILAQAANSDITSCQVNASTRVIAGAAFVDCTVLKNVIIPNDNSLVSVGNRAFGDVENELNLNYTVKDNIKYLGSSDKPYLIAVKALNGDTAETYTIDATTVIIAGGAFSSCIALTELNLDQNVNLMTIGASAFSNCRALTSIDIPDNVITIENRAFSSCAALKEVKLSKNLVAIDGEVFYNNSALEKATLPGTAANCLSNFRTSLKELHIIGGDSIPDSAFTRFQMLEKVVIDDNTIKTIGEYAFYACSNLTSINLPQGLVRIGGYSLSTLSAYEGEFIIPDTVTDIGEAAFDYSYKVSRIVIGKGVRNIGYRAFSYLFDVTMEVVEGNEYFYGVGDCVIEKATKKLITGGVNAKMPSDGSVEAIEEWAFSGRHLTSLFIDSSVTWIGEGALTYTNIMWIDYNGTKAQWKAMYRHPSWFTDGPNSCTVSCTDGYLDALAE